MIINAVKHQRHILEFLLQVHLLDVRKHAAVKPAGTYHEHRQVGYTVRDGRISHHTHRYGVSYDVVITLPESIHQLIQPGIHQELGRIRYRRACGNEINSALAAVYHITERQAVICNEVGQTLAPLAEVVAQCPLSDIKIQKDHLLAGRGESLGQMGRDKGLSGTLIDGSRDNDLHRIVLPAHE